MASTNLTSASHSEFPQRIQPATSEGFRQYNGRMIEELCRIGTEAVERFSICDYEVHWGLVDGIGCRQKAVVSDIESGLHYCLGHFREVTHG